ncbi:MAG: hypothetical protein JWP58_2084, partial [Hymenobacter sp.]|nr:hypothetical protein [Hymenobacter sp.]
AWARAAGPASHKRIKSAAERPPRNIEERYFIKKKKTAAHW